MLDFPNNDGLHYDYQTTYLYKLLWNIGIQQIATVFFLCVFASIKACIKKKQPLPDRVSQITTESNVNQNLLPQEGPVEQSVCYKIMHYICVFLYYQLILSIAVSFAVLHGFQKLARQIRGKVFWGILVGILGVLMHVGWKLILSPSGTLINERLQRLKKSPCKIFGYVLLLLVWGGIIAGLFISFNGICYCQYDDNFGSFTQTMGFSTSLTRRFTFNSKLCPDGRICHIYATLPQTTNTSVFINVHTGEDVANLYVTFSLNGTIYQPDEVYSFTPRLDEEYAQRKVWTVLFNKLAGNTLYIVDVSTPSHNITTTYKTLPNFGDISTVTKLLIGGDVGLDADGREIFTNMASQQPDLIIIGGDVAYDNAMTYCYYPWDILYGMLDKVNNPSANSSRLVPFILALGNHDVGINSLVNVYTFPNIDGPWWFAYNPQHFSSDKSKLIPDVTDRKSYGYHIIGSTVVVTLDSGYMINYEDQVANMEPTIKRFSQQNFVMMAVYHVPIYPSCFSEDSHHFQQQRVQDLGLKYYKTLFQKYKFTLCMQNHVHKLKRTEAINGVVYIGDGNMGVDAEDCPQEYQINKKIMAKALYNDSNHYWTGALYTSRIQLTAKSRHNGTQLDSAKIPFV